MAGYKLKKSDIKKEILKCGKDPVYFINNYARITHPLRGLVPFKTYPFQSTLLKDFNDYRFSIILKARQLGISTITAAYITWLMLFHREKNVLIMATQFKTACNLVRKVRSIFKNLPDWILISKIDVDNRTSIELSNGSQVKASSTAGDAGRSEALSLLVIDEAAHIENMEELWAGLYPTISTGGRCIVISTPKGVGNWFHKTYAEADQGTNDFFPVRLPWAVHPEHDQEWFEKESKNFSKREIAQEFLCNFNASGETVVHPDDIDRIEKGISDPKYRSGFDRNYWIWEEYKPSCSYLLSADVSRGDGKDYSVFHIIKLDTMEIVAEYQGKPSPDVYAPFLMSVGREYGNCMVVIENNSVGYAVLDKLVEMEYPNIYYSIKSTHDYIDPLAAMSNSSAIPGFTTSMKTRPVIIAKLEEFVRNKLITINSKRLLSEMKTFVWNNGRPQAMRSCNDDLVMALAIACWVRDTALIKNKKDQQYNKALLNSMCLASTKMNTNIAGMEGYDVKQDFLEKMIKEKKQKEEFLWLYKG